MEGASFSWIAHNVAKGASKVKEDVSNTLIAVSGLVADATKRKFSIIELKLKDASRWLPSQIKIESQAAISHF